MNKTLYFARLLFDTNNEDNQLRPVFLQEESRTVVSEDHNSYTLESDSVKLGTPIVMKKQEFTESVLLSSTPYRSGELKHYVSDPKLLPQLKKHIYDHAFFSAIRRYEFAVATYGFFFEENDLEEQLLLKMVRALNDYEIEVDARDDEDGTNMLVYCTLFRNESRILANAELMWITDADDTLNTYELSDISCRPVTEVSQIIGKVSLGTHHHPYAYICIRPGVNTVEAASKLNFALAGTLKEHLLFEKEMLDKHLDSLKNVRL